MEKKIRFTDNRIDNIKPPQKGRVFYYDTKEPKLRIQITAKGSKTFQVYAWDPFRKKPITHSLGKYPTSIVDVRKEAGRILEKIRNGEDVSEVKRAKRNEWTLQQAFDWWLENHAKPPHRSQKYHDDSEGLFNKHLQATFGGKKVGDIKKDAVRAWHKKLLEQPKERGEGTLKQSTANRCLALFRSVYSQALEHLPNPCKGVKQFRENSRERFLVPEELKRFFDATAKEPSKDIADFLITALYTGARRSNVLAMKWADIDFDLETWTIAAEESKNRAVMKIALVPEVLEILRRRKATAKSIFVFPGKGKSGHFQDPKAGWKRIVERAKLEDVRIHDLRRTLGSFQAIGGASSVIIGKSLGHKNSQSTEIYARLNLDPVRNSVQAAVALMQKSAELSEKRGEVINIGNVDNDKEK